MNVLIAIIRDNRDYVEQHQAPRKKGDKNGGIKV